MEWQSSRGSRRNRIQKEPGGRNPLINLILILILMAGAIALGYYISQAFLPIFLGGPPRTATSRNTSSNAATVQSSSSGGSEASSDSSGTSPTLVTFPEGATFIAELPTVFYYRVQALASASQENASRIMTSFHEELYLASVVPRGELFAVQVGLFGTTDEAAEFAAVLDAGGYPGAFVVEWQIALDDPAEFTANEASLRLAQSSAVSKMASYIETILQGDLPQYTYLELPEGSLEAEKQLWEEINEALRDWIEDPLARRPSLLDQMISSLEEIYAWFG